MFHVWNEEKVFFTKFGTSPILKFQFKSHVNSRKFSTHHNWEHFEHTWETRWPSVVSRTNFLTMCKSLASQFLGNGCDFCVSLLSVSSITVFSLSGIPVVSAKHRLDQCNTKPLFKDLLWHASSNLNNTVHQDNVLKPDCVSPWFCGWPGCLHGFFLNNQSAICTMPFK